MLRVCLNCKNEFDAPIREINRGYGKFCSLSCSSQYNAKLRKSKLLPNTSCAYCGVNFHIPPNKLGSSKSGLHFCCREHKDLAQRIGGIKEIQPSHYGQELSYRKKALRYLPHKCTRCDYDKNIVALAVHHKDGDHNNNALFNLEFLCMNCHAIEHWG